MKRHESFEFCELASMPTWLQRITPDYLEGALTTLQFYRPVVPLVERVLKSASVPQLVDLCAGSGGPLFQLQKWLEPQAVELVLTDKFPNPAVAQNRARVRYEPTSIDATRVPAELAGARTLFNCFHHFSPPAARAILQSAVAANEPIAIFESTERTPLAIAKTILLTPISVLAFTPLIRPLRFLRFVLLPLALFIIWWDAAVSCLRSYSPVELQDLATSLPPNDYTWESGQLRSWGLNITYLIGEPKKRSQDFARRV